ncbi:NAD(P)/FAD-dependent oxidoreductase [Achromobacter kerstersii]|uniref:NAD(P)/FAD-dependent oxidoreductase n=1 Tax=Achromobacter kerstersii TaxID=1353890 RepID=UPI0006C56C80|nr:FAD-dependent oxidoreductase [Achromobacter kerstersii]CUJ35295.1 Rhodocoxin reductase [Achromobacter kerstersii]
MSARAIVIVGAGQAGGWAATTLRSRGYDGRVLLLGEEPHAPYERPPLSKAVLSGQAAADSTELFSAARLADLDIEFRPGIAATRLRVDDKQVELSDGASAGYDKLILCTGGRPVVPALPGVSSAAVHVLRTRDDAMRLRAQLGPGKHVVIVGGGWIGLEVAATARQSGSRVTVLEQAGRLCARSVQPGVSAHLAVLHAAHGVEVRLGASLCAVHPQPDGRAVAELADGSAIAADAVVLGVGLQANDALARAAGIECERGVLVDAYCRTSAVDVYAAGDVAVSVYGGAVHTGAAHAGAADSGAVSVGAAHAGAALAGAAHTGAVSVGAAHAGAVHAGAIGRVRLESWQNAQDQGTAAALSALGESVPYTPSGAVWSEQYDAMVQIVGFPALAASEVLRPQAESRALLSVALDAGSRIVAAVAVDAPRELRQLRKWIAQGAVLDPALLQRPDVPLANAQIG